MGKPGREAKMQFTQPISQIFTMLFVLILVGIGAYIAVPAVLPVFLANPFLNGFIAMVFVFGILACFWQVYQIARSVGWIEGFVVERPGHNITQPPRLLAPLAALLRSRGARMQISSTSSRSILDSVATRIDEARDITRYIVNLLIFLGLLGTFYGLATTVPAVVDTIRSLAPQEGEEGIQVFERLMTGLEAQLGGMGVAFSSSLLGLAGSLVVGLLELFAGHGQNRFYRELEEWLSSITRVGFSSGDAEGGGADTDAIAVLAEHMAERMDALQSLILDGGPRAGDDDRVERLAAAVETLAGKIDGGGTAEGALARLVESQERLARVLEGQSRDGGAHVDAESRMRLRSMDVQLLRILEELSAGRQETVADLRTDLAQLTKAVRAIRPDAGPNGDGRG
jgi:hypothetical protein